jgi:hypothetical protein
MPMREWNPKPIPVEKITTAGFRWPEFSKEFRKKWHTEIRMLLRGHSGGKTFKAVDYPDGLRSDVHFWKEMRLWAAMAKAYADLGGDRVQDLAADLLRASTGSSKNKQADLALCLAMDAPEVLELALAGVADMRARIGAEPAEWAKEHLKATGVSPEQIEEYAAKFAYSKWPGASTS